MFDPKSRYAALAPYAVVDRRGRTVQVLPPAPAPAQSELGIHALRQGQRLDHLAAHYLADPAGFWRICEQNNAMLPDQLAEAPEITIPTRGR